MPICGKDGCKTNRNKSELLAITDRPELMNELTIFPNPANREISIVCHDVKWTNTKIFSANGLLVAERVKSCDSSIENIDVSNFKKGLYFIQIQTDKSEILVKKFLKE